MMKFRIIIVALLICGCSSGSIPKAGPVATTQGGAASIPSKNVKPQITAQTKLELPAISRSDDVVAHIGYTASYNHEMLIPNWVAYELTAEECDGAFKGKESFCWDPDLKGRQPNREDYKNDTQWDRGHMAPKADMKWSIQAYEESFFLSNVCPQNRTFNGGSWASTEKFARRIARQYGSAYIICGPIVTNQQYGTLGLPKIVIPDAFFKAVLIKKGTTYSAIAFVMQNKPETQNLKSCSMSVNDVEEAIGMDLFSSLNRSVQEEIEAHVDYSDWGI